MSTSRFYERADWYQLLWSKSSKQPDHVRRKTRFLGIFRILYNPLAVLRKPDSIMGVCMHLELLSTIVKTLRFNHGGCPYVTRIRSHGGIVFHPTVVIERRKHFSWVHAACVPDESFQAMHSVRCVDQEVTSQLIEKDAMNDWLYETNHKGRLALSCANCESRSATSAG
jgi:hypothetical protein